mgnify:CR=1 FL=1
MKQAQQIKITVLIDNNPGPKPLITRWGLSLFVEVNNIAFLFDTGPDPEALEYNANALGINLDKVEFIIISHMHFDHFGGLSYFINKKPDVTIYFPEDHYIVSQIGAKGPRVIVTSNAINKISENMYIVKFKHFITEQCVIINTAVGLIMLVGCSHPKIEQMSAYIYEHFKQRVYAIIGGFHLGSDITRLKRIIETFRRIGVQEVYPLHCSGDIAREFFEIHLKQVYKDGHVGTKIVIPCE